MTTGISRTPLALGIGLLGCGVVGSAVARAVEGSAFAIRGIAVRDLGKDRGVPSPPGVFTDDPVAVVERDDVDVVVEAIGGVNPAGALVELALQRGKDVVTVNKELLARRWTCLQQVARSSRRALR